MKNFRIFYLKIFIFFFVVNSSVYLNRHVFIMCTIFHFKWWCQRVRRHLIWANAGRTCHFVGFIVRWLNYNYWKWLSVHITYTLLSVVSYCHITPHKLCVMSLFNQRLSVNPCLQKNFRNYNTSLQGMFFWHINKDILTGNLPDGKTIYIFVEKGKPYTRIQSIVKGKWNIN